MAKAHILLVEDEPRIAQLIIKYFELEGYQYTWLNSGEKVIEQIEAITPELCILDLMLPEVSGIDLCKQIRTFSNLPIIMLTARVEEIDKLIGFKAGADDYVCKPFSPKELMARVEALLKRSQQRTPQTSVLSFEHIELDESKFLATVGNKKLNLTTNEFNLLKTLMQQPEKVFTRKELLLAVKQHELEIYERTIDTHIKNLRKKLAEASGGENYIVSVYGLGYSLKEQE